MVVYRNGSVVMKQVVLTKKIAKHGNQSVIILPSFLRDKLKPQTIVQVTIDILQEVEE